MHIPIVAALHTTANGALKLKKYFEDRRAELLRRRDGANRDRRGLVRKIGDWFRGTYRSHNRARRQQRVVRRQLAERADIHGASGGIFADGRSIAADLSERLSDAMPNTLARLGSPGAMQSNVCGIVGAVLNARDVSYDSPGMFRDRLLLQRHLTSILKSSKDASRTACAANSPTELESRPYVHPYDSEAVRSLLWAAMCKMTDADLAESEVTRRSSVQA